MRKLIDWSRRQLSDHPTLKRVAKYVFRGAISYADRRAIRSYHQWFLSQMPDETELSRQRRESATFEYRPLISIVVPVYNPPVNFFVEMLESVRTQTYQNWELVIIDDASPSDEVRKKILEYAAFEPRITYEFLKKNRRIAGATNRGIKLARGEFIGLLDNDDILQPHALYEVVSQVNKRRDANLIYSDEDKFILENKPHLAPYFKPSWNPDFLRSVNYITHFTVVRKNIFDSFGNERGEFNGAQDWELFLRISRNIDPHTIVHIPKILYSWRIHDLSTAKNIEVKPYVIAAQRKTLEEDAAQRNVSDVVIAQDHLYPAQWVSTYSTKKRTITLLVRPELAHEAEALVRMSKYARDTTVLSFKPGMKTDSIDSAFTVFAFNLPTLLDEADFPALLGDACRKEIGFVVAAYRNDEVMDNIKQLINPLALELVEYSSLRDVTKHFYATTRYNIPEVRSMGVVAIETRKLKTLGNDLSFDIANYNQALKEQGYLTLYNPYVRMIK